ncbi:MAG: glycoside hydrolase family 25 protein [bacterium]|nr:glycoside hydrolase family 25 protein [bacterium]
MTKIFILIFLGSLIISGLLVVSLYKGVIHFNYPSTKEFPVRGIDISHHQNEINWTLLKKHNLSFVFIKATEGGDYKDHLFKKNWENARKIGLARGAYHYFTFCKTGKEQAQNFIDTVPVEKNSLPPVLDLEYGGNCKARLGKEFLVNEIRDCIEALEKKYNKSPVLYVTSEFYETCLIGEFKKYKIWFRNIYGRPSLIDNRDWTFWQFNNRGKLDGIDTFVDINVFKGSMAEFEKLFSL